MGTRRYSSAGPAGPNHKIRDAAKAGRDLVAEALRALDAGNPHIVRAALGLIAAQLSDIQLLAVEAKVGPDPES